MPKQEEKKEKKVVITRKIQLILDYKEKPEVKEAFTTLYRWQNIVFKSANLICSHQFLMEQVKGMFYFTDETKVKLENIKKDENGILSTSKQNSTYQVLSKTYKGEIPMAIMTALNSNIVKSFNKEKNDYFKGEKSLRNYKKDIPIPICVSDMIHIKKTEKKDYSFSLYGINFKTFFGKDLSGNQSIFEKSLTGEYKICNSSIQIQKGKIYLLAVFEFNKELVKLNKKIIANVDLSVDFPLILDIKGKSIKIGNKEEYLHRRLAIQQALRRSQISSTFNKGGKGIQKKIAAIDRYKQAEKNYIKYRIHAYTAKLVDLCIKYNAGVLKLSNIEEVKEEAKANDFLLRNWSYYGLKEKILYKCNKYGIEVIQ